jgi:hypothetical protein
MGKTVISDELAQETLDAIRADNSKVTVDDTASAVELWYEIDALRAEINELRDLVAEAFEFGANELRPLFGQSTVALVLDACAKGLRENKK